MREKITLQRRRCRLFKLVAVGRLTSFSLFKPYTVPIEVRVSEAKVTEVFSAHNPDESRRDRATVAVRNFGSVEHEGKVYVVPKDSAGRSCVRQKQLHKSLRQQDGGVNRRAQLDRRKDNRRRHLWACGSRADRLISRLNF